jgi:hypothetical protein
VGWFYFLVAILGSAVAVGELVSRYRDAPMRALATPPALAYIAINAGASLGALALIRAFDWKFGVSGSSGDPAVRWTQTLIAGFGALAFFRSSLFIVKVGDQDIGMGPIAFLQSALGAADRGIDRERASNRSRVVGTVMTDLSFDKAYQSLPAFSLALMQNLPADRQAELGRQVDALRAAAMPDQAKLLNLGLLLMNEVGPDVLGSAVTGLGDSIKLTTPTAVATSGALATPAKSPAEPPPAALPARVDPAPAPPAGPSRRRRRSATADTPPTDGNKKPTDGDEKDG